MKSIPARRGPGALREERPFIDYKRNHLASKGGPIIAAPGVRPVHTGALVALDHVRGR